MRDVCRKSAVVRTAQQVNRFKVFRGVYMKVCIIVYTCLYESDLLCKVLLVVTLPAADDVHFPGRF